ncbi:CAX-interacting protein 4, partial [Cucurbita argyrosperma subsp. sororia]
MPATAGRVRMPANNRVHSSAALQTHGIWQSAIGYDPYAPNKDDNKSSAQQNTASSEPEAENAYASFQGLLALARITGSNANEVRGACKRCGRVGHLSFQCRNFLSVKNDKEKDPEAIQADVMSELDKLKGNIGKGNGKGAVESDEESEEEESESSDSDADSEIERIIAEREGKRTSKKRSLKRKDDLVDDGSGSDSREKKRGRSKRRSRRRESNDSDDSRRKRRKEKHRKRDDSSDEGETIKRRHRKSRKEKRRRRSHRYSDDSDSDTSEESHRRHKHKRAERGSALRREAGNIVTRRMSSPIWSSYQDQAKWSSELLGDEMDIVILSGSYGFTHNKPSHGCL